MWGNAELAGGGNEYRHCEHVSSVIMGGVEPGTHNIFAFLEDTHGRRVGEVQSLTFEAVRDWWFLL